MQPEPFTSLHQALRFGPGHCPPDLFDGGVPAIVRGLKVHANNIAHARHVALEDSYPRLASRVGLDRFHAIADAFLEQDAVRGRPLDGLGEDFSYWLAQAADRDLARAEWAWLAAFHAADSQALTPAAVAAMDADELLRARLTLHPATIIVQLEKPDDFTWDEPLAGAGDRLLISRPDAEVLLRRVGPAEADIIERLRHSPSAAELLGGDPAVLLALIETGSICLGERP